MDFFFQAEDGIRDHCVTGVQTCALPISTICCSLITNGGEIARTSPPRGRTMTQFSRAASHTRRAAPTETSKDRSEERRVGKECGARLLPEDERKMVKEEGRVGSRVAGRV